MNNIELDKCFFILEINNNASFLEMKNSYIHLRNLYSSKNIGLSPLIENLSNKRQKQIIKDIDEAYHILEKYYIEKKDQKIIEKREKFAKSNIPEFETIGGESLKLTRNVLGLDLEEIAFLSGVPIKHLMNIEEERYNLLPPRMYVRTFVKKFAEQLSLNPSKAADDYIKKMEDFFAKKKK